MPDLSTVFSTSDFIPHGHCYLWRPTLVWLHLVSDTLIALAYYAIPVSLVYFARRRQDLPFKWVFWLFGAFIVACGTTHLLDVWTLWHPTYWVSGVVKLLTALLSVATAVTLFRLLPAALQLPSQAQLEATNLLLQQEIAQHERTEADLRARKAALRNAQQLARLGNWSLDLQTQTRTWSDELYRLFGLDPQAPLPALETMWQRFTDHSREQLRQAMARATTEGLGFELEVQYTRPDGSLGWFQAHGRALRDNTGVVSQLVGTLQEITERKQTEALLSLQSIVVRNMAEGVCLTRVADGVIVYANPKFERLFGYAAGALAGQHVSVVNYEDVQTHTQAVYAALVQQIVETGEATYEVHNVKQDGTPFWCQATTSMFEHPEWGTVFVGVQQDITERKRAEDAIRTALKEKQVLLQEIHHRVKNNLQIVYSLLRLQRLLLRDPQAAAVLLESQNRIEAIALVHEKLYRAEDLAHIDASEYIPNLVVNLVSTYGLHAHQVQLELAIEPLPLSMDCAVPCGLMINELVSNAFKYAFPDQRPGQLTVSLGTETADTTTDQTPYVTLTVADNGVGLPAHVSLSDATTLGLQLVSDSSSEASHWFDQWTHPALSVPGVALPT